MSQRMTPAMKRALTRLVETNPPAKNLAPATALRFCKDCAHFRAPFSEEKGRHLFECTCPALLSMVTGRASNPERNRNNENLCGKGAMHFKEQP